MRFGVMGAVVGLSLLVAAPMAEAAQRYASTTGSGTACTEGAPCLLKEAVTNAASNDEVIVAAGTYTTNEPLVTPGGALNVHIHGDLGGQMPTIVGKTSVPIEIPDGGGVLSYLDITNTANVAYGALCTLDGRIERVRVTATGNNMVGLGLSGNCVVRDSVVRADGTEAIAIDAGFTEGSYTGVLRNVTATAKGLSAVGVRGEYKGLFEKGSYTLDVRNTIADGVTDLLASGNPEGPGHILVSNSNFDTSKAQFGATITDAGGNQTTQPLFVNAAAGDYRESPGSPTIDAGTVNQLGGLDLAGSPRVLGAAPDIGAFEVVPPPALPGQIQSLAIAPKTFRAANVGGAIVSAKKKKAPVASTVTYSLSAPTTAKFTVERKTTGRKVKGKCKKQTASNKTKKKCPLYKPLKGSFAHSGVAGQNRFKFSGRLGGKPLKPGSYRLVGTTSTASRRASFRIVK
jgi:hypothetical protein